MRAWKLYDHFDEKELKKELWELIIPDTVYKEDVSLTLKNSVLTFEATKRKRSENPYDWEGPRLIAKKGKHCGIRANLGLDFRNCRGNGNVYLRANGYEFLYLIGIDNLSRDVFFHTFDVNTGCYVPRGRVHFKDYFLYGGTLASPELISLGILFEDGKIIYSIDEEEHELSLKKLEKLNKRLVKDSKRIEKEGLQEVCIKVDLYAPHGEPSSIKALIDNVEVKYI